MTISHLLQQLSHVSFQSPGWKHLLLLLFISITREQVPLWGSADGLCNWHQGKGPGNEVGTVPRGDSLNNKGGGCSSEILERNPKRNQEPVLWAWLQILSPMPAARGLQILLVFYQHPAWFISL